MWDFHRSKSSAILIGRCRQTPRRTTGNNRILTGGTGLRPPVLQYMGGSGTPTRPKRDTSRTGFCLAPSSSSVTFRRWLLTPPEGEFEQKSRSAKSYPAPGANESVDMDAQVERQV